MKSFLTLFHKKSFKYSHISLLIEKRHFVCRVAHLPAHKYLSLTPVRFFFKPLALFASDHRINAKKHVFTLIFGKVCYFFRFNVGFRYKFKNNFCISILVRLISTQDFFRYDTQYDHTL